MMRINQPRDESKGRLWLQRETVLMGLLLLVVAALAWVGVVRQAAGMQDISPGGTGIDWDDTSGETNGHFAPFNWRA